MAAFCINPNFPDHQELIKRVGLENAQRLIMAKEHLGMEAATAEALRMTDPTQYTKKEKQDRLTAQSDKVSPPNRSKSTLDAIRANEAIVPKYTIQGTGKELTSVSERLDKEEETKYRGDEQGYAYADKGTVVHKLYEDIINEASDANIRKLAEDNNISPEFVADARSFIESLKQRGTVMAETRVFNAEHAIAGTVDIIHLRDDGQIDVYDIKTAFYTPNMALRNEESPWGPEEHFGGYKARRYSTQLEFYSKMVEDTTGLPVTNKYIIPVEVYSENNNVDEGFKTLKRLPREDISTYTYGGPGGKARKIVDRAFGIQTKMELPNLTENDSSNDIMSSLIGYQVGRVIDADKQAERIIDDARTGANGIKSWKNPLAPGSGWVPFRNQNNRTAQKQQIYDEYLSKREFARRDISESIINYLSTGDDVFISSTETQAKNLKKILDKYIGNGRMMEGLRAYDLNTIEGFKNKENWIVIEDTVNNRMDLIYYGNENIESTIALDNKFSISGFFTGGTLFGKYMTKGQAKNFLKTSLSNTVKDAKAFEGAMIAFQLKKDNPNLTFGDSFVYSSSPEYYGLPTYIDFSETLPALQNAMNSENKALREIFPTWMRELSNDKALFDWNNYQQDYFQTFNSYAKMMQDDKNGFIVSRINQYTQKAVADQKMIEFLSNEINKTQVGNLPIEEKARKLYLLSQMIFQVENVATNPEPISLTKQWVSMPTNINNSIIQDIVKRTRQSLADISREFFEYKRGSVDQIKALFGDENIAERAAKGDFIVSATSRFYEPLIKTTEITINANTGETKRVKTFEMVEEDSDEFSRLTKRQQNFIVYFNNTVERFAAKSNVKWKRGRIPLVKATFANRFFEAKGEGKQAYGDILKSMFENVDETFTFSKRESIDGEGDINIVNPFMKQRNSDDNAGTWEKMTGVNDSGFMSPDGLASNKSWSTNLEVVLDMFAIASIRTEGFENIGAFISAGRSVFEWQRSNLFEQRLGGAVKWLDVWSEGVLLNRSQDTGSFFDRMTRTLNKWASVSLIGLKPSTAIVATTGQQLTSMSQAIAQTFDGSERFTIKDWMRAGGIVHNPKNINAVWGGHNKVDLLMEEYRMFNHDFSSIVSGYHRYGNHSAFRMKYLYGMLNMGDWASRGQILVAQMINDGSWDAYTMTEDGQLEYDETKDPRWKGEDGQIMLREMKKIMADEGGLNDDGTLKRGYDNRTSESMKFDADSIIGGFDRETRGMYNFFWFGKLLGLFKTWLPARLNRGFDSGFVNETAGKWSLEENEEGQRVAVWKGRQMEGLVQTFLLYAFDLKQMMTKGERVQFEPHQKENLRRMMGDIAIMGAAFLAYATLPDDERETKIDDQSALLIRRAIDDLISTYNAIAVVGALNPIAIQHAMTVLNLTWNAAANIDNPNDNSLERLATKTIPVANMVRDVSNYVNYED